MKLELKHLAPYLPYGLKCWVKDYPMELKNGATNDVFMLDALYRQGNLECVFHDLVESEKGFKDIKPILSPLSDLNKKDHCVFSTPEYNQDIGILMSPNVSKIDIQETQYVVMEKLFEWHFDVFGLIPQGLAIDINTLTGFDL